MSGYSLSYDNCCICKLLSLLHGCTNTNTIIGKHVLPSDIVDNVNTNTNTNTIIGKHILPKCQTLRDPSSRQNTHWPGRSECLKIIMKSYDDDDDDHDHDDDDGHDDDDDDDLIFLIFIISNNCFLGSCI